MINNHSSQNGEINVSLFSFLLLGFLSYEDRDEVDGDMPVHWHDYEDARMYRTVMVLEL